MGAAAAVSTPELVELIKAVGTAVSLIIGAVTIGYARVSAKRAKEASQQTSTSTHVDGHLRRRSSAETAEDALRKTEQLKDITDGLLGQVLAIRAELARKPGLGKRRVHTEATPVVKETDHDPW